MSKKFREGDVAAIPLKKGGYALAVIARVAKRGHIVLCYFFGTRFAELAEAVSAISVLRKGDAFAIARVGDPCLIDGSWPIIGSITPWERGLWPLPGFVTGGYLPGDKLLVHYSEETLSEPISRERVPDNFVGLPGGLWGNFYAEDYLSLHLPQTI